MTQIVDGRGTGIRAKVTQDFRLATSSASFPLQALQSLTKQRAYQAVSGERTIATAGAYGILGIRNVSTGFAVITYIRMGVDSVETSECKCEVLTGGTWAAGTESPIVNMNQNSSLASGLEANYNAIPTDSPDVIDVHWLKGPGEVVYRKEGSIVIPSGRHLALRMTTSTNGATIHGRISFFVLSTVEELNV